MSFPVTMLFTRALNTVVTVENHAQVIAFVEELIKKDRADNVLVDGDVISFKGTTGAVRYSLYGAVDKGSITIQCAPYSCQIKSFISMERLFITTLRMSAFFGGMSIVSGGPPWVFLFFLFWLCGVNWVITILRHGANATHIANSIDKHFFIKH